MFVIVFITMCIGVHLNCVKVSGTEKIMLELSVSERLGESEHIIK